MRLDGESEGTHVHRTVGTNRNRGARLPFSVSLVWRRERVPSHAKRWPHRLRHRHAGRTSHRAACAKATERHALGVRERRWRRRRQHHSARVLALLCVAACCYICRRRRRTRPQLHVEPPFARFKWESNHGRVVRLDVPLSFGEPEFGGPWTLEGTTLK